MTSREKKAFALGGGIGLLVAALVAGVLVAKQIRPVVASSIPARPTATATADAGHSQQGTEPGTTVSLSPAEITAAGVQVAEVRTATLKTDIAAFGRVEQPESQLAAVSARIGGRVDKLYVQYTGERVRAARQSPTSIALKWPRPSRSIGWRRRTAINCSNRTMHLRASRPTRW